MMVMIVIPDPANSAVAVVTVIEVLSQTVVDVVSGVIRGVMQRVVAGRVSKTIVVIGQCRARVVMAAQECRIPIGPVEMLPSEMLVVQTLILQSLMILSSQRLGSMMLQELRTVVLCSRLRRQTGVVDQMTGAVILQELRTLVLGIPQNVRIHMVLRRISRMQVRGMILVEGGIQVMLRRRVAKMLLVNDVISQVP